MNSSLCLYPSFLGLFLVRAGGGFLAAARGAVSVTSAASAAEAAAVFAGAAVAEASTAEAAAVVHGAFFARGGDGLGLDLVHFLFVEVVGLEDHAAEDFLAEVDIALDVADGFAGAAEEGDDIGSALL